MDMPTQEEQDLAERYVLKRPLVRPDTDLKKAVICVSLFMVITALTGLGMLFLSSWVGISSSFASSVAAFRAESPLLFYVLFFLSWYLICGLFAARFAVIGAVRLYQHYAPEEVRRRCLMMPTCSEYCILVVKKYGVIIGLILAWYRLFFKCRGNIYSIDLP